MLYKSELTNVSVPYLCSLCQIFTVSMGVKSALMSGDAFRPPQITEKGQPHGGDMMYGAD